LRAGELVVDLGAGEGALTAPLVASGARVLAVELHPRRAAGLRERFATDPVTVVECDIAEFRLPHRPFRVVANPPYSLSSAVVRSLLAPGSQLVGADLVLPSHVVRRFAERRAVVARSRRYTLHRGPTLPRRAFRPPSQVDSAVLVVRRR
jgi:23S rRNA (adenine-N6)-dimethyltransferase